MKNETTLKSIANELGVSVSTISRALNNKSIVNEKTRKKVLELAEKYSYVPNEIARSLQKSSSRTIAVVLPDISEVFFGRIVKEISKILSEHGYMLLLADTNEDKNTERNHLLSLHKHRVDALVLATVDNEEKHAQSFEQNSIPVVYIDNVPENTDSSAVTVDNFLAGKLGVEHLYKKGHTQIATIMGLQSEISGSLRLKGFLDGMNENGLSVDKNLVLFGDYKFTSGYEKMLELLKTRQTNPFTAVYIASEKMTYGAVKAIRDSGLKIPEDISVLGFDVHDNDFGRTLNLSSVRQPEQQIGAKVGNLLVSALVKDAPYKKEKIALSPFIQEGDSIKQLI